MQKLFVTIISHQILIKIFKKLEINQLGCSTSSEMEFGENKSHVSYLDRLERKAVSRMESS